MEDEFYHLTVKGNDLKAYMRRFQELATLCPTMVPNSEKMIEVFIGGLPQSTDIAKISRKRSKLDKHRHGNGIECAKVERMLSKVNSGQPYKDKT
ncbi:hypothetical protein Tco_0042553 [Tanacetum coccineum]